MNMDREKRAMEEMDRDEFFEIRMLEKSTQILWALLLIAAIIIPVIIIIVSSGKIILGIAAGLLIALFGAIAIFSLSVFADLARDLKYTNKLLKEKLDQADKMDEGK